MSTAITLDRRAFLRLGAVAGGGLLLAVESLSCSSVGKRAAASGTPFTPNAFLRLDSDGTMTLVVGRQEMGQGVRSGLPRIVAAEMDAEWSRVHLEQGDFDEKYGDQYAGGSNSTQHDFTRLRQAGAATRWLLMSAAAHEWQVPVTELRTESGRITHARGDTYLVRNTLTRAAERLPSPPFLRTHRAVLVNADRIAHIEEVATGEHCVFLRDGTRLPLSRRYRRRLPTLER